MKIGKEIEIKTTEELSIVATALTKHRKKKGKRKRNIFRNIFCWIFKREKPVYRYTKVELLPLTPSTPMAALPSGALRMHDRMEKRRQTKRLPQTEAIRLKEIVKEKL